MADRTKQKARTRRDLVNAARELAGQGHSPELPEVATAAGVSTATAYRYFPNVRALWQVVQVEDVMPSRAEMFAGTDPADVPGRIRTLVDQLGSTQFDNETLWRNILRASLDRWFEQAGLPEAEQVPIRSEARLDYIDEALAGLPAGTPDETRRRLRYALTLVVGADAMVALRDSCRLPKDEAVDVMSWAAAALVDAALPRGG